MPGCTKSCCIDRRPAWNNKINIFDLLKWFSHSNLSLIYLCVFGTIKIQDYILVE